MWAYHKSHREEERPMDATNNTFNVEENINASAENVEAPLAPPTPFVPNFTNLVKKIIYFHLLHLILILPFHLVRHLNLVRL